MARRLRNEGSVFERADGRWCAVLDLGRKNGRRRRRYFYAATAEDARKALESARQTRQHLRENLEDSGTLKAYAAQWIEEIALDLKPRTVTSYRQPLDCHILGPLGLMKLVAIKRTDVKKLLAEKRKSGLSKNTVRLIRATPPRGRAPPAG